MDLACCLVAARFLRVDRERLHLEAATESATVALLDFLCPLMSIALARIATCLALLCLAANPGTAGTMFFADGFGSGDFTACSSTFPPQPPEL